MKSITIVTGNSGKVRELTAMATGRLKFRMQDLDLTEIQSLDLHTIVCDKAQRAYDIVQSPVIVEDVSAGLDSLAGLPGPFIKFFNREIGNDALWVLAKTDNEPVTIQCVAAYYDGEHTLFGEGTLHGTIVEPRGKNGFGFDAVVVPDGQTRTLAEMTTVEKSAISHRGMAFRDLLQQLESLR